jgi:Putative restriction endonuclease
MASRFFNSRWAFWFCGSSLKTSSNCRRASATHGAHTEGRFHWLTEDALRHKVADHESYGLPGRKHVEISDTTLSKDRGQKLRAYARNLIPEYWIVNLPDQQIEVYRQPHGDSYRVQEVLRPGDIVSPLAKPDAQVLVAELLP